MIEITNQPIDLNKVFPSVLDDRSGGVVHFVGTVRREEGIAHLDYECYPEMALKVLQQIVAEVEKKWEGAKASAVHRYGRLEIGEVAVAVAVSAPHRAEAFAACRYVIDELKERAPLWKR